MLFRFSILVVFFAGVALYIATHAIPLPEEISSRWVKISPEGNPISPWDGPWGCVYDQQTGLLWEVKTDNESVHDAQWSYSWFNGATGKPDAGSCLFESAGCDTLDLIKRTNQRELCGVKDWTLPSASKLSALLSSQELPGRALIDNRFFPHIPKGDYWSADGNLPLENHYKHLGKGAHAINFENGEKTALPYRNAAFVILVTTEYRFKDFNQQKNIKRRD